jgi:succinyl-diaminopimelate desuccinylase
MLLTTSSLATAQTQNPMASLDAVCNEVAALASRLVGVPSAYPPGDTNLMAEAVVQAIADVPEIEVERYRTLPHVTNLVLRLRGNRPGRRLVFNGHMDTFPLVDRSRWTANPAGEERDGKLYGLGVSDMKGGIAAILTAMRFLAGNRHLFAGEVVATFVGDEESMGSQGTQWLLDNVAHARGDAMISADTGSPYVLRFGEKGMLWLSLSAEGKSAHAAHVHRGDSAIEKLIDVINDLKSLRDLPVSAIPEVTASIDASSAISEARSGAGETEVLKSVTITFGTIKGGTISNLVADHAEATADVRIPVGVTAAEVETRVHEIVARHPGVSVNVARRYEPNWTDPQHPVIRALVSNCEAVLKTTPAVNMRVGASDSRLYRYAGVPTVVCGLTSYNMGGADEHIDVNELRSVAKIFSLTVLDFLSQ